MTTQTWPFGADADRSDALTKLRVPAVTSFRPEWKYVAAFLIPVRPGETDYSWRSSRRPTMAESRMLASFIQEYIQYFFRESYQRKLAERELDVDSGCNTTVFIKYGNDDWGYRLDSWQYGPAFIPQAPHFADREGPLTLEQVMDRRHTIGDEPMKHWLDWKAAHPDVFGSES